MTKTLAAYNSEAAEAQRLDALRSYGVLDTAHDAAFDALVRVASAVCETPVALVTLVDERRQWFLASTGLDGVREAPREIALCAYAILEPEIMVVEDTTLDARFAANPLVVGEPHIRFYAGCPLVDGAGHALGTLCVVGSTPRTLSTVQAAVLRELSVAVVRLLEARRADNALRVAEEATRRATADLAIVLDSISAAVSYWDTRLCNRFANDALCRATGWTCDELRGRHAREVFGQEPFAVLFPVMEAALRGVSQHIDVERPDHEGRTRHLSVSVTPDVQGGSVVGFIATANDVTDLKTALLTSQRTNELLVLAEEVANLGHWHIDARSQAVYWSPQIYRILGRDLATSTPTLASAVDACHPEDREKVRQCVARALERNEAFELEARLIRDDGAARRVHIRGECQLDAATGATRSVVGVIQDVTDQLELRERVALHDRLVTTGTLAAGVAHEINNPLTYVSANVEIALDALHATPEGALTKHAADELVEVLTDAREGAERIRQIVSGLRALARADNVLAPTDARQAIELAASMAAHELRSRARLIIEGDDMPVVVAEKSRLSQVFVNLFTNAAQSFAGNDPERNRIVLRSRRLAEDRVVFEVEDNGSGIRAEVLPRIFDPFFTTKPIGHGTGLGLAICHEIVASMGGEILCSTQLGVGTTFRVVLGAAPDADAARKTSAILPHTAPAAPAAPAGQRTRGRVLVVDDEVAVGRTIERALRDEHDVTVVNDSREALRLLSGAAVPYDLVFCDLSMPHLSGAELHERVRTQAPATVERFVFITGGAVDEKLEAFLAATSNECLRKPFRNIESLRVIARRYVAADGGRLSRAS